MACFLLVTRFPELLLSVPLFFRRIADLTRLAAALPYFAMITPSRLTMVGDSAGRRVGPKSRLVPFR